MEATLRQTAEQVVGAWEPRAKVEEITPLLQDFSLRRYFRLRLSGASVSTVVFAVYDSVEGPEFEGGQRINSDRAFVALGEFLRKHGVTVPLIFHDEEKRHLLLLEDVGDLLLGSVIAQRSEEARHLAEQCLSSALQEIYKIQAIPPCPGFFAFERCFSGQSYVKEMEELWEFVILPTAPSEQVQTVFREFSQALASTLENYPRVLVHRDFHAGNLLCSPNGGVRVIDFQDALMATDVYDLVSLLNDRDMDGLLGKRSYLELLEAFIRHRVARTAEAREAVLCRFNHVSLQRDIKTAGRFGKLAKLRGRVQYLDWVPGNLRRIGRALRRESELGVLGAPARQMVQELSPLFVELGKGYQEGSWY